MIGVAGGSAIVITLGHSLAIRGPGYSALRPGPRPGLPQAPSPRRTWAADGGSEASSCRTLTDRRWRRRRAGRRAVSARIVCPRFSCISMIAPGAQTSLDVVDDRGVAGAQRVPGVDRPQDLQNILSRRTISSTMRSWSNCNGGRNSSSIRAARHHAGSAAWPGQPPHKPAAAPSPPGPGGSSYGRRGPRAGPRAAASPARPRCSGRPRRTSPARGPAGACAARSGCTCPGPSSNVNADGVARRGPPQ